MALEQEYKFVLDDLPEPASFIAALARAGLAVKDLGLRQQRDVYYDSPAGALRERGQALRRRSYEGKRLATLKEAGQTEGGLHAREELELPLENGDWPAAIRARLRDTLKERVALEALRPVATLETERQRYALSAGGKALAELSIDAVAATRGETRARFYELELEAVGGEVHDLADIAGLLLETLPLTPTSLSKLERALMIFKESGGHA